MVCIRSQSKGRTIYELGISFLFVFRNIISFILKENNGNYDLLYLFGIYIVIYSLFKRRRMFINIVVNVTPFLLMVFIEGVFSTAQLDYKRVFIILLKTALCIALMLYGKENLHKCNIDNCVDCIINIFCILTISALIFPDSHLWIHNDFINNFSKTRLKLVYLEPTYLALHLSIIMVYLFWQILHKKRNKKFYIIRFLISCVILMLSGGLGGIGILVIGLTIIMTAKYIEVIMECKVSTFLLLLSVMIPVVAFLLIYYQPAILYRLIAIMNGEDSSVNYRIMKSLRGFINIMSETGGIGLGLGNINTVLGLELLSKWKIETVLVNAYLYFFSENGILGIIYVLIFNYVLLKYARKSTLKFSIFIMVTVYQFLGGYFTDPGIWFCYGIILMPVSKKIIMDSKIIKRQMVIV